MFPWNQGENAAPTRPRSGRRAPPINTQRSDAPQASTGPRSPAQKIKAHRSPQRGGSEEAQAQAMIEEYKRMLENCYTGLATLDQKAAVGEISASDAALKRNQIRGIRASLHTKLDLLLAEFNPSEQQHSGPTPLGDHAQLGSIGGAAIPVQHQSLGIQTKAIDAHTSHLPGLSDVQKVSGVRAPVNKSSMQQEQGRADAIALALQEKEEVEKAYAAAKQKQQEMAYQIEMRRRQELADRKDKERKMHARLAAAEAAEEQHRAAQAQAQARAAHEAAEEAARPKPGVNDFSQQQLDTMERERRLAGLCRIDPSQTLSPQAENTSMLVQLPSNATAQQIAEHSKLLQKAEEMVHRRINRIDGKMHADILSNAARAAPKAGRRAATPAM
eukprot:TRINITY_DN2377_c0_g1_i3.p1 TRINITY_DN2377_c0_g1~~TRINITY_DN2377_c0_g1_i3.p1  ORF type:complete len:387 (+),score=107.92 TRINITY_DN2377_c0_g1_i3:77-1237(+)